MSRNQLIVIFCLKYQALTPDFLVGKLRYLKIPADKIFYPDTKIQRPNLQNLLTVLSDCTEQEADELLPFTPNLLNLLRKK